MKRIKSIESGQIREIAEYFAEQGFTITYFGKAWSGCTNNWIYFDTYFDVESLKEKFKPGTNLIVHENLDPKSGTERGFIDNETGEGVMGNIEKKS